MAFIIILGFLYNTQFLNTFIRKIPFIKIFHVALVWALINSWLIMPAIQWDVFFITFFLVSGLILPFDIRDMQYDTVTTFPQIIGIQNTKYLAYLLLFFSSLIAVFSLQPDFAFCYSLSVAVGFIFIYFAQPSRPDAYYSFGVETVSGLPFLLHLLQKLF
ncbi:prenyltransferase [Elizabethkingia miricola]|nr:prenyltransferase [Elizabethkingia miricola]